MRLVAMKKLIILFIVLINSFQLHGQSGNKMLNSKKLDSEYYYLEFKSYFDKENYYEALEKIENAIDAAPLHADISPYYFYKGEIYRRLYEASRKISDLDNAIKAFRESAQLDNRPKTAFRMNYCLFEKEKFIAQQTARANKVALETTLDGMWQSILDFEEISEWDADIWESLNEEFNMFLEKCIDVGLLSSEPNAYLSKIFNVCRRGQSVEDQVLVKQWNQIETKMRLDGYNLPCSGNFYLAHKRAIQAIRENSDILYDHAVSYYKAAADTAMTPKARAEIYSELSHFVNSPPFYRLYDAVEYAKIAYEAMSQEEKYVEEYGELGLVLANHIIRNEIAGKETFSANIKKALKYTEEATRFEWSSRVQAMLLCSIYYEWLQNPWDERQSYLMKSRGHIVRAFNTTPDKENEVILNQLIKVHKKLGAKGIRELRSLVEEHNIVLTEQDLMEEKALSNNRADILLGQLKELKTQLYEITLNNYNKFIDIRDKVNLLTYSEKSSPTYTELMEGISYIKTKMDQLFSKKVDVLNRIGYSKSQEEEFRQLSAKIMSDNILAISDNTRDKITRISGPFRGMNN